jgi:nitrilase
MRTVIAAAVQLSPVLYSREGTVDRVVHKIHELGQEGVQFATFPETVGALLPVLFVHPVGVPDDCRARAPQIARSGSDGAVSSY